MRFLRAMGAEIGLIFRLTFANEIDWRPIAGIRSRLGWMADRHLRNGFFVAALVFVVGIATGRFSGSAPVAFATAFGSNIVWIAFAAWSRGRARRTRPEPQDR